MNAHKFDDGLVLWTDIICPPYDNNYSCVSQNYDGAPDAGYQIVGTGCTEQAAIDDWFKKQQEWKDYNPDAIGGPW